MIVCAGPSTSRLLATAGVAVPGTATLEQVAYLAPAAAQPPQMPIFLYHNGVHCPYGLPVPGSDLYKIGIHLSGPLADPASQGQEADEIMTAELTRLARELLPGFAPEPVATERCIYDNSPDDDFILDRAGNLVIGSGENEAQYTQRDQESHGLFPLQ